MSDETKDEAEGPDYNQKITIKLTHPIDIGNTHIDEIGLRPVKGKDMRLMKVDEARSAASVMWLAGRLSGHIQAVTDELQGKDLCAVIKTVNGFLAGIQGTGDESSDD